MWKPTQLVRDLISSKGVASNLPRGLKIATGIQLPTSSKVETPTDVAFKGEKADFCNKYLLVAETSEADALEP